MVKLATVNEIHNIINIIHDAKSWKTFMTVGIEKINSQYWIHMGIYVSFISLHVNLHGQLSFFNKEIGNGVLAILLSLKYYGLCPVLEWFDHPTFQIWWLIRVKVWNWWSNRARFSTCYKSIEYRWGGNMCRWWVICGYSLYGACCHIFVL